MDLSLFSTKRTTPDSLSLLRSIARGNRFPSVCSFNQRQIDWIIKTGLAPLFCFLSQTDPDREFTEHWPRLTASDLTIRIINTLQLETLREILTRCKYLLPPITLLKGCSIGTEIYPEPHLRVMRDLDILVGSLEQPVVERVLLEMGFRQRSTNSPQYYDSHHHSMPFYHGEKGVWVEVHTGLFPLRKKLTESAVFSRQNIEAESRLSLMGDIPVLRLSAELQIIYIASHWGLDLIDLKREGGLFALLDIIYLMRSAPQGLRWNVMLDWANNSVAGTHLYLALSYLARHRLITLDKEILAQLRRRQKAFGTVNLKIAHQLIDRYTVTGRIPLAKGKTSILWEHLLRDNGPALNLASFCLRMLTPAA